MPTHHDFGALRRPVVLHETAQELFDRVALHLLRQGRGSYLITTPDPTRPQLTKVSCLYRLQESDSTCLSCAIGHLIPDDAYDPSVERSAVHSLRLSTPNIWKGPLLLNRLQSVHDRVCDRSRKLGSPLVGPAWRYFIAEELAQVAAQYALSMAVVEQFPRAVV